jgi:hypothetical protein
LNTSSSELTRSPFTASLVIPETLTSLTGVTFEEAWERRVRGDLDGVPVAFLSLETLIKNKRATGRTQDAADVEKLES